MKCEAPLGYLDALELSRSLSRAPARVVLVAGSHCAPASCPSHNRSCEYVAALVRYFEGRFPSARVSLRLGHTADGPTIPLPAHRPPPHNHHHHHHQNQPHPISPPHHGLPHVVQQLRFQLRFPQHLLLRLLLPLHRLWHRRHPTSQRPAVRVLPSRRDAGSRPSVSASRYIHPLPSPPPHHHVPLSRSSSTGSTSSRLAAERERRESAGGGSSGYSVRVSLISCLCASIIVGIGLCRLRCPHNSSMSASAESLELYLRSESAPYSFLSVRRS